MIKILLILILIFGAVFFGFFIVVRFLRNTFSGMFNINNQKQSMKKEEDVIYKQDDIVVLKGEAQKKSKKKDGDGK